MTAFLYLPSTCDAGPARRVDLADFGSLFAEAEEPKPVNRQPGQRRRTVATCLLLLVTLGDTLLISRSDALASGFAYAKTAIRAAAI